MHGEYSLKYLLSTVLKTLANLRPELIIKKEKKNTSLFLNMQSIYNTTCDTHYSHHSCC